MKQFLSFVQKEFYHIFRDKRTMLILLGLPVVQILLFGFAISTEVKDVSVAVFDSSHDDAAREIVAEIEASHYFRVVAELSSSQQINEIFQKGKVGMVVVFTDRFSDNLLHNKEATIQLIADGTDPNQGSMAVGYLTQILNSYAQRLAPHAGVAYQIVPEIKMLYNPQSKSAYNFVPGVMGMIMLLICAMMTAIAIVREKENGTMEVLLASPMRPLYIILAKAIPYFTLSAVNIITILFLSVFVLEVPIAGSLVGLVAVSLLFIFLSLALGLLISTRVNTQVAAMLISGMGLMMPVMLLSGMIYPIESMPPILQWISTIVPARWYISAVRKLMIQGVPIVYAMKELLILSAMALFLLVLSLKSFKTRLK